MNRHNDKNIKDVLALFLKSNQKLSEGYQSTRIEDIWKHRMGKTIASYTSSIRLKDGILLISISSGPLRKELQMAQKQIITIINEEMGENFVIDIKIT